MKIKSLLIAILGALLLSFGLGTALIESPAEQILPTLTQVIAPDYASDESEAPATQAASTAASDSISQTEIITVPISVAAGNTIDQPSPTAAAEGLMPTPTKTPSAGVSYGEPPSGLAETAALRIAGDIPDHLIIRSINVDAPVVKAAYDKLVVQGETFLTYRVPNYYAAGWHRTSARLGVAGNTVMSGHHNIYGEVFKDLVLLNPGDKIEVLSGSKVYTYVVANKLILPEKDQPVEVRMNNARWIMPTTDERLTLVTCWPHNNNTHRLIIVARPMPADENFDPQTVEPLPIPPAPTPTPLPPTPTPKSSPPRSPTSEPES